MTAQQPKALELADALESNVSSCDDPTDPAISLAFSSAEILRAQHTFIRTQHAELETLRSEVQRLTAQKDVLFQLMRDKIDGMMERMVSEVERPGREAQQVSREALTQAAKDVLVERHRQVEVEGWTPEHDDSHHVGSLAWAASAYATSSVQIGDSLSCAASLFHRTGWAKKWFKPRSRREDLVRAGALILAEIERLDRATPPYLRGLGGSSESQSGNAK